MKDIESFKLKVHRFLNRDLGVILSYHSVVGCSLEFDMWTHMPLELFEEHMAILSREANVIPLLDMVSGVEHRSLPSHAVSVTFDDGFGNNYTRAYPILQRYRIPATIFLSTGFIGTEKLYWPERLAYQLMKTEEGEICALGYTFGLNDKGKRRQVYTYLRDHLKKLHPVALDVELAHIERALKVPLRHEDPLFREWLPLDWSQVREMGASGLIAFGGHTVGHHILSRLDEREAEDQIESCRKTLDAHLDGSTTLWAYPNGTAMDFSKSHGLMLKKHGFSAAVTSVPSYPSLDSDPMSLGRWDIGSVCGSFELRTILAKRNRWDSLQSGSRLVKAVKGVACGLVWTLRHRMNQATDRHA